MRQRSEQRDEEAQGQDERQRHRHAAMDPEGPEGRRDPRAGPRRAGRPGAVAERSLDRVLDLRPDQVRDGDGKDLDEGGNQAPPNEDHPGGDRQTDDRGAGQEDACGAGEDGGHIAPADRPVVVGQDELEQTEGQRSGEAELERPEDVLASGAEQGQRTGHQGGDPRSDARSTHERPQRHHHPEVHPHHAQLEGDVAIDAEDPVPDPEVEDQAHAEVAGVRFEQIVERGVAFGEELPVVAEEPEVIAETQHQEQAGRHEEHAEGDGGGEGAAIAVLGRGRWARDLSIWRG